MRKGLLLALGAGAAALLYLHDADKPAGNFARLATTPDGKLYRNLDNGDVEFVTPDGHMQLVKNVPLESGWRLEKVSGSTLTWFNVGGAEDGRRYAWTLSASGNITAEGYV
jgi:hypothetical protein